MLMNPTEVIRTRRSRLATLLLAIASWPALAQGPGWTAPSKVTSLVVTSSGGINVSLAPSLTGCVSQSGYGGSYASIYPNHPGIDRMKADLLTALATGATVALYLGDNQCRVDEMQIMAPN
jgi:hypothetical protein